jgi:hypothetical protein
MISTPIEGSQEWEVIFNEGKHWRIGIYRPKYFAAHEITELEEHSCPESFLLLKGNLVMLHKNKEGLLLETKLEPMQLITFTEPHAGFSSDGTGVAFVVENAEFETTYTDKTSGAVTRQVKVK